MDDEAGGDESRTLRLQLDLQLDSQPIRGRICTDSGAEEHFVGWLGFADVLRRLHDLRAAATDQTEDGSGAS